MHSKTRTILPVALAFALSGSLAFAQQTAPTPTPDATTQAPPPAGHHHGPKAQKEIAHLTKALNLTPDQATKLEPILADRDQKIAALQADTSLTPDAREQQMKSIHKASEEQVHSILTPDQLAQMKAMHHGHEGKGADQTQPLNPAPSA